MPNFTLGALAYPTAAVPIRSGVPAAQQRQLGVGRDGLSPHASGASWLLMGDDIRRRPRDLARCSSQSAGSQPDSASSITTTSPLRRPDRTSVSPVDARSPGQSREKAYNLLFGVPAPNAPKKLL